MNTPALFLVGATHRTAPFGFREKLALGTEAEAGIAWELAGLRSLREFMVLNTCNRVEIYGVATEEGAADQVAAAFCARQHVDAAVASASNVFLYNLDDLARIAKKNRLARMVEAERGRQVLVPRADSLWQQVRMQLAGGGDDRSLPSPAAPVQGRSASLPAFI